MTATTDNHCGSVLGSDRIAQISCEGCNSTLPGKVVSDHRYPGGKWTAGRRLQSECRFSSEYRSPRIAQNQSSRLRIHGDVRCGHRRLLKSNMLTTKNNVPISHFEISGEAPQSLPQLHSRRRPKGRVRRRYPPNGFVRLPSARSGDLVSDPFVPYCHQPESTHECEAPGSGHCQVPHKRSKLKYPAHQAAHHCLNLLQAAWDGCALLNCEKGTNSIRS